MADVVIYTTSWCPYCSRVKAVLDARGTSYREIDIEDDPQAEAKMVEASGGLRTVPQVFIDGRHIGGAQELGALHSSGKLDELLGEGDAG